MSSLPTSRQVGGLGGLLFWGDNSASSDDRVATMVQNLLAHIELPFGISFMSSATKRYIIDGRGLEQAKYLVSGT
ncbi:hypothetical protein IEQ34_006453 [Dendrobium chrysotoxum]|uniref:Uncharacterized protein n=1 Tax=Dendrobium chrysotoxum TaxID=161865 RepID=A0AAV7GWT4_DENCH|nr:hypothetical protein IEQ34_006453 [Dendrobium chrysotoxum]